ncbi:MAG: exodeoxyribonuclease VII large subunit [Muribaculaceae bacterium]|nr:exodeoxyribonuclease VII large subunit [Muribaculaceae bacterium]
MDEQSLTLLQLNQRIAALMTVPDTQNVWVTAELSDVSARGGHCYMELLQKHPETGATLAKARGVIWANVYSRLSVEFQCATGQRFKSGLKVMVRASASMHPVYGMSLVITAIDPEYTMGDLLRRRREILDRLQREGILEMNRQLDWCEVPLRIAVISARGAAGYGDFINQLYTNTSRLNFKTQLFEAVMQGDRTPSTIIAALNQIASQQEEWDGVVIIRGGGATSDLVAFEDYDLAANIAQFPLPIIVGIGHERDTTVLDYVANMRVKTPTAAAEWLIEQGDKALNWLRSTGAEILQIVSDRIAGNKEQLSRYETLLPTLPLMAVEREQSRLRGDMMSLAQISTRRIVPELSRLGHVASAIASASDVIIRRRSDRLDSIQAMLNALSPEAILRRGYSITRVNGKAVTDASQILAGTLIETTLANGTIISETK